MASLEVVLDTNIWVRYFIKNEFKKLTLLVMDNDLVVFTSERFIAELEEVLAYPRISKLLSLPIEEYVLFHKNLTTLSRVAYAFRGSPDPKDDFLFDLALSAGASYLVTNDKPLLDLGEVRSVKVVSLSEFFQLIK